MALCILLLLISTTLISVTGMENKRVFHSRNMEPVDAKVWEIPSGHLYDNIFEITEKNHENRVLQSEDAWIIIFYTKNVDKKWRQLAEYIGGAVWFGTVEIKHNKRLINKLKLDFSDLKTEGGVAVIYPMDYKIKMEQVRSGKLNIVTEPGQAELSVSALIPDRSKDFDFLPRSMKSFNDWIVDAYYSSRPPKFPVLCITEGTETPLHVKVLTYYFYSHFSFGIVRKSSLPYMKKHFKQLPNIESYPTFLVLLGTEPSSDEMSRGEYKMTFNLVPYIEKKYGDPTHIRSVIDFLLVTNHDYRDTLPGRSSGESEDVITMKSIRKRLVKRVNDVYGKDKKKISRDEL